MKELTLCWALAVVPYAKERMRYRDVKYNMTRSPRTILNCIGGLCSHCPFSGNEVCLTARLASHMTFQSNRLERGKDLMEILNRGETPWIWYTCSMDDRSNSVWHIAVFTHRLNAWYGNQATVTTRRFTAMNVRCMLWIDMIHKYAFAYIEDPLILYVGCWSHIHDAVTTVENAFICQTYTHPTDHTTAARLRKTSRTLTRKLPVIYLRVWGMSVVWSSFKRRLSLSWCA